MDIKAYRRLARSVLELAIDDLQGPSDVDASKFTSSDWCSYLCRVAGLDVAEYRDAAKKSPGYIPSRMRIPRKDIERMISKGKRKKYRGRRVHIHGTGPDGEDITIWGVGNAAAIIGVTDMAVCHAMKQGRKIRGWRFERI